MYTQPLFFSLLFRISSLELRVEVTLSDLSKVKCLMRSGRIGIPRQPISKALFCFSPPNPTQWWTVRQWQKSLTSSLPGTGLRTAILFFFLSPSFHSFEEHVGTSFLQMIWFRLSSLQSQLSHTSCKLYQLTSLGSEGSQILGSSFIL